MAVMQQVIATARGYDGKVTREVGERFEMPAGAAGSWFISTDHELPDLGEAKPAAKKPVNPKASG